MKFPWLAVLVMFLSIHAFAQQPDQRFCIVPVAGAAPGDGRAGETWRLTMHTFHVSGLPAPIFTPDIGHPWTIDAERRLVPYTGPYPHSFLDTGHWVHEPWSGRVVAIAYGGGVSAIPAGADHFETIEAGASIKHFSAITLLPRRRLTIVIENDLPLIVGDSLKPWFSLNELAMHGIRGTRGLYDSPYLSATIIRDTDNGVHVLTDDDAWHDIGSVRGTWAGYLVDVPSSGAALLFADGAELAIRKEGAGAKPSFVAQTIESTTMPTGGDIFASKLFGQALAYRSKFLRSERWQRLTPEGFVDVDGGNFRIPQRKFFDAHFYVHDLPSIGRTLIEGAERLYLYDGTSIVPVRDAEHERYGDFIDIYDLPSIGRVLIATRFGIFELTRDGALVARLMPFPTEGIFPRPVFADWPKAGAALVATKSGVFVLDRDLKATPILGGDQIDLIGGDFTHGDVASTGDMILDGHRGVFLAVDGQGPGGGVCGHEQQLRQLIADSNLCLREVPNTDEASLGFRVGQMAEAPGKKGLLVDTVAGLFLQRDDGSFLNLEPRTGQYLRGLATLPWSGDVLLTGYRGAIVRDDLSPQTFEGQSKLQGVFPSMRGALVFTDQDGGGVRLLRLDDDGKYRFKETKLKDVNASLDAPWFGGALVWTGSGLFVLDADGSALPFEISDTKAASVARSSLSGDVYTRTLFGAEDFFALDRFKTVYVRRQRDGWFRITSDRKWLPVHGLPNTLILAYADPGNGEVLFGTGHGIFALNADGDARRLEGPGYPSQIRAFADTGDSILAGGSEGLFEVRKDLSSAILVENGSAASIGAIADIFDVGFAGFDIVKASYGTYAFENGHLERIQELSAAGRASDPSIFPSLRRALVTKIDEPKSLIFELGRYERHGQCTASITP